MGRTKISTVLHGLGYSLQSNRKTHEGKDHPDRDAQFEHINKRAKAYRRGGRPAISVDTKKKKSLGNKADAGRKYRPKGSPRRVDTHDFPDIKKGKAIPYGVYDIDENKDNSMAHLHNDEPRQYISGAPIGDQSNTSKSPQKISRAGQYHP